MNAADYLIIAVLLLSILLGFFRGFLKEAIGLIAWLGGLWLAWRYAHLVEPHLGGLLAEPPVRIWVARAIVLILVVLTGWLAGSVLAYFVHQSGLSLMLDRMLGMLFGLLRGAVLVSILVILGQLVELDEVDWWKQSRLMPYASEFSRWIRNFADSAVDELQEQVAEV